MKKTLLLNLLAILTLISACSKKSDKDDDNTAENTWTFTQGSKKFSGSFFFGSASLNTLLQSNNSYTFGMLGAESTTGHLFNIVLSLLDTTFTTKTYKSGVAGDDYLNAFYYSETLAGVETYKSSNLDPGPVMNYTITNYDAANDVVTIEFSGQAQLENGTYVPITAGKLKVKIERL